MSSHKLSNIKIPPFDRDNYILWKKKMMLFLDMANTTYGELLKNGPFTPVILVPETTVGDEIVPAQWVPKDPSLYSDSEKEKIAMDKSLQLILIESLDLVMYNNIVNCTSEKQIWEK